MSKGRIIGRVVRGINKDKIQRFYWACTKPTDAVITGAHVYGLFRSQINALPLSGVFFGLFDFEHPFSFLSCLYEEGEARMLRKPSFRKLIYIHIPDRVHQRRNQIEAVSFEACIVEHRSHTPAVRLPMRSGCSVRRGPFSDLIKQASHVQHGS